MVEQCFRKAKVSGSIPLIGSSGYSLVVECDLPKVEMRVRFPLPAPAIIVFVQALFIPSYCTFEPHQVLGMKTPLVYPQPLPGFEPATIDLSVLDV